MQMRYQNSINLRKILALIVKMEEDGYIYISKNELLDYAIYAYGAERGCIENDIFIFEKHGNLDSFDLENIDSIEAFYNKLIIKCTYSNITREIFGTGDYHFLISDNHVGIKKK